MKQSTNYACVFRMNPRPWTSAIIVFNDGQCCVQRNRANPSSPVVIELEGVEPTHEQIELCMHIWAALSRHFNFSVASFDEKLQPFAHKIRAPVLDLVAN